MSTEYTENYGAIIPSVIEYGKIYPLTDTIKISISYEIKNIKVIPIGIDAPRENQRHISSLIRTKRIAKSWIISLYVIQTQYHTNHTTGEHSYIYFIDNYGIIYVQVYRYSQAKIITPYDRPQPIDPTYDISTNTLLITYLPLKELYKKLKPLPNFFIDIIKKNMMIPVTANKQYTQSRIPRGIQEVENRNALRMGRVPIQYKEEDFPEPPSIITYNMGNNPQTFQTIYNSFLENLDTSEKYKLQYEDIIEELKDKVQGFVEKSENDDKTIEELQDKLKELEEENKKLVTTHVSNKTEIKDLVSINETLEKEHNKLKVRQQEYDDQISKLHEMLKRISNKFTEKFGGKKNRKTKKHKR